MTSSNVLERPVVEHRDHEVGVVAGLGRHPRADVGGVQVHGYPAYEDGVGVRLTQLAALADDLVKSLHGAYYTSPETKMIPAMFPPATIVVEAPRGRPTP